MATPLRVDTAAVKDAHTAEDRAVSEEKPHRKDCPDLLQYKDLFYKVQNLEKFPEILPEARDLLLTLFAETIEVARKASEPGILSVDQYSPESLIEHLQNEHDNITRDWEEYVARRRAGGPTELFSDKEECRWWLKQVAPVKYVDGAWLGHINKVTTPFGLRRATKDAWQVMSEELGDGQPVMNHVYVYRELMAEIGAGLPDGDQLDFIDPRHRLDEEIPWKAAVAQLLISLFPHEFLPEILGFNMHFEGLTMETMQAAKEVEELGLNAYYFILHISIDNADSGHTAIAMQAVVKYLDTVRQAEGEAAVQRAWKRVQAGFILSKHLAIGPVCPSKRPSAAEEFPRNIREAEVMDIFKAKAPVAHKIHCTSRVRLGGRKLVDWLDPRALANPQWQMEFMDTLGNFKPWVRKGDSTGSKLMQELSWEGKMFGSFTQNEVEAVRRWIDALGTPDPQVYWSFVERTPVPSSDIFHQPDIRTDYPVLAANVKSALSSSAAQLSPPVFPPSPSVHPSSATAKGVTEPDVSQLLPLWFTHQCLLESFVNVPSKTTTVTASSIVKTLRAQYGFDVEGFCVAGMDEVRRSDSAGLVELGLEMMQALKLKRPTSLKEVLEAYPSDFAVQMLHLSMRPMENFGFLLGLAWAFIGLHELMATSPLLLPARRAVLTQMVRRERDSLEVTFTNLKADERLLVDFSQGFEVGRREILKCFPKGADHDLLTPAIVPIVSHRVAISA